MESWRRILREAALPALSTEGLQALLSGITDEDPQLIQRGICIPPLFDDTDDWAVEAGDLIGYAGWKSGACRTVSECTAYHAQVLKDIDARLGAKGASHPLVNWYDDEPREEVWAALLPEIRRELNRRWACATRLQPI